MPLLPDIAEKLQHNLHCIQQRLEQALRQAGRSGQPVLLVAVTKYVPEEVAAELVRLGCRHLGESRPQQLWRKAETLPGEVVWHQVGHLQRNKVRRTLRYARWIHSGDRWPLLQTLQQEAQAAGVRPKVLLQVNISGEEAKGGFRPEELPQIVPRLEELPDLEICGLMGMSGLGASPEEKSRQFGLLRGLRNQLQPLCPPGVELRELSMGMSDDFPLAVAQGATIVRIGSALYEGLDLERS